MSRVSPRLRLLATLVAIVSVVATNTPLLLVALGAPPSFALLASTRGRRLFGRRLLATAPLIAAAIALRSLTHANARALAFPALRVVGAIAWSSWLTLSLEPAELRSALRGLGVPLALVELIAHTRRFAIQLAETTVEARNAAALRGGFLSARALAKTVGHVAGIIVVRAFDRAESVAIAGALRGNSSEEAPSLAASSARLQELR